MQRFAGIVLSAGILLSACGNSNTEVKTYSYVYTSGPSSLNYLENKLQQPMISVVNLVDGEQNDSSGTITHLSEDWSVSKDGLFYTYKLRKC